MYMSRRGITIDNGGSELRYIANTDGREILALEKEMRVLDRSLFRVKDNVDDYDIIDISKSSNTEFEGLYAIGVGYYMYEGIDLSLDSQSKKSDNPSWYKQILVAIAIDAMKAKRRIWKSDVEIEDCTKSFDFDYVVAPLIPAREHSGSVDYVTKLKTQLEGTYEVCFPAIQDDINFVTFSICKEDVGVLPEGAVAISSIGSELTPEVYSMVMDMGKTTNEIVIFKGKVMIGAAVCTSKFAGSTLTSLVSASLKDNGCINTDIASLHALKTNTGTVKKKEILLAKDVDRVKKQFVSNYVKADVFEALSLAGISADVIENFIPIGGVLGMQHPETKEHDIVNMIVEECNMTNADIRILDEDLRHVNINKAAVYCDKMLKRV